jgi:hypothetical protein
LVSTLTILWWTLKFSHYGLDVTDEGFYLAWISNPFVYDDSVTQFGFVYHILYRWFDGDLPSIRHANILFTFSLGWLFSDAIVKLLFQSELCEWWRRLLISGAIAVGSLVVFSSWLVTPSYNSLALQSILITLLGVVYLNDIVSRIRSIGWVLVGLGGWLAFMAKPTTAAALGISILVYLKLSKKLNIAGLSVSIFISIGCLLVSALVIDGSVINFIDRLVSGAEIIAVLGGGHTWSQILRVSSFKLGDRACMYFYIIIVLANLMLFLAASRRKISQLVGILFQLVILISVSAVIIYKGSFSLNAGAFQSLLILAIPCSSIINCIGSKGLKTFKILDRHEWCLIILLAVIPYAFAFGTNGNYWQSGSSAGLFWALIGIFFLKPLSLEIHPCRSLTVMAVICQCVVVALLASGMDRPYRQIQPLKKNNFDLNIGYEGSTLRLSRQYGEYLQTILETSKKAHFIQGTPIIDLTGQSPGILYVIGAMNLGQAWLLGGYPGSDQFAIMALRKVPCDQLSVAWVLREPGGPRQLGDNVVSDLSDDLSMDYKLVAEWHTPIGVGGNKMSRTQQLLKPVRAFDDVVKKCRKTRRAKREKL